MSKLTTMKFILLSLMLVKFSAAGSPDHRQDCPKFNELGWEISPNGNVL